MRQTLWAGVMLAVLDWTARSANACSCALPIADPVEATRVATLVVAARVTSIETVDVSFESTSCKGAVCETVPTTVQSPRLRLQVLREWKGSGRGEYLVLAEYVWSLDGSTPTPMLDCVLPIRVGEEYLIFASYNYEVRVADDRTPVQVDSCSPVGRLRESANTVKRLDRRQGRTR